MDTNTSAFFRDASGKVIHLPCGREATQGMKRASNTPYHRCRHCECQRRKERNPQREPRAAKSNEWPPFAFAQSSDWGACYSAYLASRFDRSGSQITFVRYQQVLRDFLTSPALMPDEYNRSHVETYLRSPGRAPTRMGRPIAPGTMNNRLTILKGFFAYAATFPVYRDGRPYPLFTQLAPTAGVQATQQAQHYQYLLPDEISRFFAAIPRDTERGQRDYCLFLTWLLTARRSSEILSLRWGDIQQNTIVEDGAARTIWVYSFAPKRHKRQRSSAELPTVCYDAIMKYLEMGGRLHTIQPGDPIFIANYSYRGPGGYDPQRPLNQQTMLNRVKHYAQAASIDRRKATIHTFRHTSARLRLAQGSKLEEVSEALGHANLATTHRYVAAIAGVADVGSRHLADRYGNL